MCAMASQITGVFIVCSTVGSGADHRKHQSSASLAFVRGIHRWPVNSPYKRPVKRKMFPFDHVIIKLAPLSTPFSNTFSTLKCLRCLLHHILSLIAHTFRENRDFFFIIIVQFMMSANSRIRFGLEVVSVCLYITPSHSHHCADLSEDIEHIKCRLSDIFCRVYECVSKIKHILSVIHYTISGAVYFQFTHFPCDDWENIHFVLSSSSNRKYELLSIG